MLDKNDPVFLEYRRKWKEWPENFENGDFPLHLDIEASSVCNLRCEFCEATIDNIGTRSGYMDIETFTKIIDEGVECGLYAIKLNSGARGEPLLNKNIIKMVEYAKKKGIIDVYMNTNAVLLTKEMGYGLIKAGLDRISISFEGTDPAIYEKYRVGAKFEKVRQNILDFVELRNSMGSGNPKIRMQTVGVPEILKDINKYVGYWSEIVDEIAFIDSKDYKNIKKSLVSDWACPYIWQRMMVTWDGTISVCGFDYSNDFNLGNVKSDSIREAWNGTEMEQIRNLHKKGMAHKVAICDGCSFRTTEIYKRS
ncbi:radical SAM/SPASM domain-containing protein [Methanolobus psychrotolerans]|uniref:radical SAM/SPASM domain-containing protein n=1 Tax=Methanolobus psychrotolerans TaxID=1874706 RepID=UPI0013EDCA70|nr:radical SAM protein [Methanolobus psychrotolerans]